MRHTVVAALAACLVAASCGTAYKSASEEFLRTQPPSAWRSPPPAGHHDAERQWILQRLRDPGSAQMSFAAPRRVTIAASLTDPTVVPVWASDVAVNAKNAFGGYTGAKTWSFYYDDGRLVAVDVPERGRIYVGR